MAQTLIRQEQIEDYISTATQTALDLKAPLASPTLTGTTTVDRLTYDQAETPPVAIGDSGASQTIDASTGSVFTTSLTGNCAFTFSNFTAGRRIELHLYGDGTQRTPTFPTAKTVYNDTTIAYPTDTTDLLVLTARHNGTEVVISAAGNYAAFA